MIGMKNSFAFIVGLIAIGIVMGVVLTTSFDLDKKSVAGTQTTKVFTDAAELDVLDDQSVTVSSFNPNMMFVDIVKKVRPSIVSIYTAKNVRIDQSPFFFWFRNMPRDQDHSFEQRQDGLGSGIIISEDGYILTNNHVIEDVDELRVKLIDNREFDAKVIGRDPATEVALIKIEAKGLPVAVLGNSDEVQIGEWVMAIGSPLHLTSTVTAGIVSALSRNINIIRDGDTGGIENFIQTDAAINPGNSGGALLNLKGHVIGINTAIATRTNYYMGYGFAVPINIAKSVVKDLMEYGEVRRGYLGVYIEAMDPVKARGVKLDKPRGVLVINVIAKSAADKAGIKEGDVILSVNGQEVNQPNELQARVAIQNPGDKVDLEVWRYGKKMQVTATLQGRDGESSVAASKKEEKKESIRNVGLTIQNLTAEQARNLELKAGVLVMNVDRGSVASRAGLNRGDVIFEINNNEIKSVNDFYSKIGEMNTGEVVSLKVRRKQNNNLFDRLIFMEIHAN